MQAEQQDQRSRDGSQQRAILTQKTTHSAGRSTEGNENHRETNDKRQRGSEKPAFWLLPLAQLLYPNAREHRDIARNQRKHARRQERYQPREKGTGKRDISHKLSCPSPFYSRTKQTRDWEGTYTTRR